MIYIPDEWIVKKENMEYVHQLLSKINSDFVINGDTTFTDTLEEIKAIGETIIIEKIEDGTIVFGA